MKLPNDYTDKSMERVVQQVLGLNDYAEELKLKKDIAEKYGLLNWEAGKIIERYRTQEKTKPTKRETEKEIATKLIEEFDIITLDDTRQIMVKSNNCYKFKEPNFTTRLNELINQEDLTTYKNSKFNIIEDIADQTLFNREDFCYDKWLINFENGYYDIKTDCFYDNGELKFFYEIPHKWDGEKHQCPKFINALHDWLGKGTVVKHNDVFEMLGYCMSMNTKFKKAFYFYGDANSGKTTFQTIVETVIGKRNRAALTLHRLSERFGTHGLQFKILNMCGELSDRKISKTNQIKLLIGGDTHIGAEPKGGDHYKFRNVVKLLFGANKIPMIADTTDTAFFDRFILVYFRNWFPKNPDFVDTIIKDEEEIAGILYQSVLGYKRIMERGDFRKEIMENTDLVWKIESDSLYKFIYDFCKVGKDQLIKKDLFLDAYNKFRYEEGEKPIDKISLSIRLKEHKIYPKRITEMGVTERFYIGVSLNTLS